MAYAEDLKSSGVKAPCGFESRPRHHLFESELPATTSLARLLDKQGKREEARAMLAEIYHWFTEGFDIADLRDAKSLLHQFKDYSASASVFAGCPRDGATSDA